MLKYLVILTVLFFIPQANNGNPPVSPTLDWREYALPNRRDIALRWRNVGVADSEGNHFLEMKFTNVSGEHVEFYYVIVSDSSELMYGLVSLEANNDRLFGWNFKGSSIDHVECGSPDSVQNLLRSLE